MPRKSLGARLYEHPQTGLFWIRDGAIVRSTGARDHREAEKALAAYIAGRGVVAGPRHPDRLPVSDALRHYLEEHAVTRADPVRLSYAADALLDFWGGSMVGDVKKETCRRYAVSRTRSLKDGTVRQISDGTIRRELNVLQAAINHCHASGYLTTPTKVTLPEKPPSRDRWLTREEAARLLWAAWRSPKGKHLAHYILIALYTGTRKAAILQLGFVRNTTGGWIDVEKGVLYRRGAEERQTKKRRKPVRLPRKLLGHCRRWQASGTLWPVHVRRHRVADVQTAFERACERAGLSGVTPHTLKHTAITWAMQKGMRIEDAADYFDTSEATIRSTYYHHHPDYQSEAVAILDRKL